jgi:hypothetical protein
MIFLFPFTFFVTWTKVVIEDDRNRLVGFLFGGGAYTFVVVAEGCEKLEASGMLRCDSGMRGVLVV